MSSPHPLFLIFGFPIFPTPKKSRSVNKFKRLNIKDMTLEEAKNILENEGFKLHKASSKLTGFSETFERYESPEIVEAIHVLFEKNYNLSMESHLFNERKERLKKEYEAMTMTPGDESPAIKESAKLFNDALLDEQAKKIEHLDELSASRNKIIVKQSKKISKLRKVVRDKDAVLSDVSEELRLSKVREEKLTEVCQKYLKEIDELKDKVGHADQRMNDAYASCQEMKKKIDGRDAEISGLKEELADAKKMIGMVRNASKEYHDWGVAANEFIKKLSSLYLQAHNENRFDIGMLMRCKDYKTYGFPAIISQETKEEINDIASGKERKKPIEDDIMEGCKEMMRMNIKLMRDLLGE